MLKSVLHLTLQLALQLILQVLGRGSDIYILNSAIYVVCLITEFLGLCNDFYHFQFSLSWRNHTDPWA